MAKILYRASQSSVRPKLWQPAALFLIALLMTVSALGERDQTCHLKGGNQQADYHCPEHYDAVVAGEGTDKCDGSCYATKNIGSLSTALSEIINRRFHLKSLPESFTPLARRLEERGSVRIRAGETLFIVQTAAGYTLHQTAPTDLTLRVRPDEAR